MLNTYSQLLKCLKAQASQDANGHRDQSMRKFNRALLKHLETDPFFNQTIKNIFEIRSGITADHLTDLLARSAQYSFRKNSISNYAAFSEEQFLDWLQHLTGPSLTDFLYPLNRYNVATHIPERYRAAAASVSAISFKKGKITALDIGSSGGLGLPAISSPPHLLRDSSGNGFTLVDSTPGEIIRRQISRSSSGITAVNLDSQPVDWEWIYCCSYFSDYEKQRIRLESDQRDLIPHRKNVQEIVGDISDKNTFKKLKKDYLFDFIYASMSTYQMSDREFTQALRHIEQLMLDRGVFMELTWIDRTDWFKPWNVQSTARFKLENKLSPPFQWLIWDNSRCREVKPGVDFQKVNLLLEI